MNKEKIKGFRDVSFAEESKDSMQVENVKRFNNGISIFIDHNMEKLELKNDSGDIYLNIDMTSHGPQVTIKAGILSITSNQEMHIESNLVKIRAKEKLILESEGDFVETIKGNKNVNIEGISNNKALIQNLIANLGNVNIKANDDLRLDGEKILINCD